MYTRARNSLPASYPTRGSEVVRGSRHRWPLAFSWQQVGRQPRATAALYRRSQLKPLDGRQQPSESESVL